MNDFDKTGTSMGIQRVPVRERRDEQERDKTLWEMLTYPTCEDSSGRSIFESGDSRSAVRATEDRGASTLVELVRRLYWEVQPQSGPDSPDVRRPNFDNVWPPPGKGELASRLNWEL